MKTTLTLSSLIAIAMGSMAFTALSSAQEAGVSTSEISSTEARSERQIAIWRDPSCGCCDTYAEYLEAIGYRVTRIDDRDFEKRSIAAGVPAKGLGCHLAKVEGYYISGLVPAEIIERLVTERPKITGITLPGMPANAPGMAAKKTGKLKTYAFGGERGVTVYSDE